MKLTRKATGETVTLDDGFFWSDEDWSPIKQTNEHATNGVLITQVGIKQAGRPITLKPANQKKGWIKLRELRQLREWQALIEEEFLLEFEIPDARVFNVIFNNEGSALESSPIKNSPATSLDDYFNVTMRFMELENAD
jgi:hypothetical protein